MAEPQGWAGDQEVGLSGRLQRTLVEVEVSPCPPHEQRIPGGLGRDGEEERLGIGR